MRSKMFLHRHVCNEWVTSFHFLFVYTYIYDHKYIILLTLMHSLFITLLRVHSLKKKEKNQV